MDVEGTHKWIKNLWTFAAELAIALFTSYELRKKIDVVDKYCKNWNMKSNWST